MKRLFLLFAQSEKGTTSIEYALIASAISLAIIVAVTNMGASVTRMFQLIVDSYPK